MNIKKVLLVEAPYDYLNYVGDIVGTYFPLGIGYIASYIREYGYNVRIFQPNSPREYINDLMKEISEFKPDVVGFSVMTSSYSKAVDLCRLLKENFDVITIMGGHHISAMPYEVLVESKHADFLVIGEGEITFLELLKELEKENPAFEKIDGIAWRRNENDVVVNKYRSYAEDIDMFPYPARDLVDMSRFRHHSYIELGKKSATMISSRGCPFQCIFCSSGLTMGKKYRFRSVKNIMGEINLLVENYGIQHILFFDDTMTLKKDRLEELCEEILKIPKEKRPTWNCMSRVNYIDEDIARKMKKAGCTFISFGIESGSEVILKKIGKNISLAEAKSAVAACNKAGLKTQCTFIVGFPFDTEETINMTLEAAKEIAPTFAIFFALTPYPGTRLFNEFIDKEQIPKNITGWDSFIATNNTSNVSLNKTFSGMEIKKIAERWNRKFYFRPKQLIKLAKSIHGYTEFKAYAKGGIYLLQTLFGRG